MATATENINLNLGGNALQQLQKLETQMGKISKSFLGLRNVLAGLSFGAFVTNAYKFADAMDDTAKATNIAAANVIGFAQAVQKNGGDLEGASNALNKFVENIGEAADGSIKMQETFAKVGVSLEDLRTLSEQDLLKKTLDGLSKIDDASLRAKLSVDLLSKGIKGVDVKGVAGDYDAASAAASKYAESNKAAADASDNLQVIQTKLTQELLLTLKPISDMVKSIDANSESFMRMFNAIKTVVEVLGSLFIIGRLVTLFLRLRGAIAVAGEAMSKLRMKEIFAPGTGDRIFKTIKFLEERLKDVAKAKKGVYAPGEAQRLEHEIGQFKRLGDVLERAKEFFAGVGVAAAGAAAAVVGYFTGGPKEEDLQEVKIQSKKRETVREVDTGEYKKKIAGLTEITKKLKDQNDQLIKNIQSEATYLKMSENGAEIAKAQTEIYENAMQSIADLQQKAVGETKQVQAEIVKQISLIEKSIPIDQERATKAIQNLQAIRNEQDKVNHSLEIYNMELANNEGIQKIQDEISLLGLVGDELEQAKIQLTAQQELRQKMIGYAEELANIERNRVRLGNDAADREIAQIQDKIILAQQYYNESLANEQALAEKRKATEESSTYAIKQRMEEIKKQSTPAQVALGRFNAVFEGMSKSLDNFITTGKFKFKDFALSIIQDLIKIEAQRAASKLFSSIATGVGGFLGSIFGFAEGGTPPTNKPSLVGEKGPELFVPRAAGTIIPNDQLSGSTRAMGGPITNNYITNNISALDAKSVAELFAQNRKTLLGSVKMAEREMPYAAR